MRFRKPKQNIEVQESEYERAWRELCELQDSIKASRSARAKVERLKAVGQWLEYWNSEVMQVCGVCGKGVPNDWTASLVRSPDSWTVSAVHMACARAKELNKILHSDDIIKDGD